MSYGPIYGSINRPLPGSSGFRFVVGLLYADVSRVTVRGFRNERLMLRRRDPRNARGKTMSSMVPMDEGSCAANGDHGNSGCRYCTEIATETCEVPVYAVELKRGGGWLQVQ